MSIRFLIQEHKNQKMKSESTINTEDVAAKLHIASLEEKNKPQELAKRNKGDYLKALADVAFLNARIYQLEQELESAKKDQARYQWLRDQNNFRGDLYPSVYNDFFDKSYFFEELDSIVDAAIKESSK